MTVFGIFYTPDYNEQLIPPLYFTREDAEEAIQKRYRYHDDDTDAEVEDRVVMYRVNVKELEVKGERKTR